LIRSFTNTGRNYADAETVISMATNPVNKHDIYNWEVGLELLCWWSICQPITHYH